ncbi:MAG: L-threonylcarbamoyladenylate synthase [Myxococcota bacterium]|jgi:tRNA threonylcarbamoyl adenosine modification protein (Sua5/YciO/YrdC/YwlC family)|nr:L-threonylcarbamoyladenylate synthase [Myxococcota bacterium]
MLLAIDPEYPEGYLVHQVVRELRRDGVVILPTDTVYALACDIHSIVAMKRLAKIKGKERQKLFSILLGDLAEIGTYAENVGTHSYRTMKRLLPGAYTFILEASTVIPKLMATRRRTIGIRLPDCPITLAVAEQLGNPLVTTTLGMDEDPFLSDPYALHDSFGNDVAMVVDGGVIRTEPSSVVDLSGPYPEVLREGRGDVSLFQE